MNWHDSNRVKINIFLNIRLGGKLRAENYDQAIVLPNSWKSALIPFFAGILKRTGFLGECRWGLLNDARRLDKKMLSMTVQRFVALGFSPNNALPAYSFPALNVTESQQESVIEKFDLRFSKPVLVLCAGAEYGSAKRWPETHLRNWRCIKSLRVGRCG